MSNKFYISVALAFQIDKLNALAPYPFALECLQSILLWKWFGCSCFLFILTQIMDTCMYTMLASHRFTRQERALPPPTLLCWLSTIVWQKCIYVSKKLDSRKSVRKRDWAWKAGASGVQLRLRQRTWCPAERWPLPWIHTPTLWGQERDPHQPLAESFVTKIGHSTVSTHTEFLSPMAHNYTHTHTHAHTRTHTHTHAHTRTHTHTHTHTYIQTFTQICSFYVCLRFLCQWWTAGFGVACVPIPSGDDSKWSFTKSPQSSQSPEETNGTNPNLRQIIQLYI